MESFQTDRKQRVLVNGMTSEWKSVTSGIPQGSVLGLILFVLYINDLPDVVSHGSIPYLFVDDTKIYHSIYRTQDCENLHKDITAV
ncbi:MAG: reverse transcriptase domain-containing protein [Candidatus Thiodiazotropha sp.]